jgi:dihydroorotate dehydrogenase electron transfer subunit
MMQTDARVIFNKPVMSCTRLLRLHAPEIATQANPGQFVMVRCGEETVLPRPLSVHSTDGDHLELLFAVRGAGTEWLSHLKKGENLKIFGPMGNGFTVPGIAKNLVLVAGGIGIAPLCFLAEMAVWSGVDVTLLIGASNARFIYPRKYLPPDAKVVIATDDGSMGHKGLVTELLPEFAAGADLIAACGPLPMYRYMAANMKKSGLKEKSVEISLEMRMGCGLGVCYGCTIRTKNGLKQVCKDGPVFPLGEIIWDEFVRV